MARSHRGTGQDFWSTGIYEAIIPLEKIVATDSFADEDDNVVPAEHYGMDGLPLELTITVIFEAVDDASTRMTLMHAGIPAGKLREQCRTGWNESFDKLDKVLN